MSAMRLKTSSGRINNNSDDILITSNKRTTRVFDLYRYHADTGQLELIGLNPGTVILWLTNQHGQLMGRARKGETDWVYENALPTSGDTHWQPAFTVPLRDRVIPIRVTNDNQFVWALSNRDRDTMALVRLELANGQETVFFSDPRVDLTHAFVSNKTDQPLAVEMEPGAQEWKFFDPDLQNIVEKFAIRPATRIDIGNFSRDETQLILTVQDDRGGQNLLVNTQTQANTLLGTLTSSRIHAISPLPVQRPIAFTARDGLTLHGYLTSPVNPQGKALLHAPTVVLVHGGPWARDVPRLDSLPFFLANRGYAVLQVNYRGSSGYGKAFQEAARGEFAGKMHTDLLDGVDHLVQLGVTDPTKVAIMGMSYGGYASLVGMTHTPNRFACGISMFGMSDISSLLTDAPPYWDLDLFWWHDYVGNPERPDERERMREKSPLYKAANVQGPVLILHGARDARVHLDQSTRMVEALQKAGKPVDFVLFPKAGHNLYRWVDRLHFYRKTEDFLGKCLGGRTRGFDFFELGNMVF